MKRLMMLVVCLGASALPLALVHAAGSEPKLDREPAWMAKARKELKAYPEPAEGMIRYVLYLEPKEDESLYQVELQVGKTIETDGVNRYGFGGTVKKETVKGWGYSMYTVEKGSFDNPFSTRIGVPAGRPKVKKFVQLGGGPGLVRYNSKLPIVVYVPAGGEVRYRIWAAPPQATAVLQG